MDGKGYLLIKRSQSPTASEFGAEVEDNESSFYASKGAKVQGEVEGAEVTGMMQGANKLGVRVCSNWHNVKVPLCWRSVG